MKDGSDKICSFGESNPEGIRQVDKNALKWTKLSSRRFLKC